MLGHFPHLASHGKAEPKRQAVHTGLGPGPHPQPPVSTSSAAGRPAPATRSSPAHFAVGGARASPRPRPRRERSPLPGTQFRPPEAFRPHTTPRPLVPRREVEAHRLPSPLTGAATPLPGPRVAPTRPSSLPRPPAASLPRDHRGGLAASVRADWVSLPFPFHRAGRSGRVAP